MFAGLLGLSHVFCPLVTSSPIYTLVTIAPSRNQRSVPHVPQFHIPIHFATMTELKTLPVSGKNLDKSYKKLYQN